MTREILCPRCAPQVYQNIKPPEFVLHRPGRLRNQAFCDSCNRVLLPGAPAIALSVFLTKEEYRPWEKQYLLSNIS